FGQDFYGQAVFAFLIFSFLCRATPIDIFEFIIANLLTRFLFLILYTEQFTLLIARSNIFDNWIAYTKPFTFLVPIQNHLPLLLFFFAGFSIAEKLISIKNCSVAAHGPNLWRKCCLYIGLFFSARFSVIIAYGLLQDFLLVVFYFLEINGYIMLLHASMSHSFLMKSRHLLLVVFVITGTLTASRSWENCQFLAMYQWDIHGHVFYLLNHYDLVVFPTLELLPMHFLHYGVLMLNMYQLIKIIFPFLSSDVKLFVYALYISSSGDGLTCTVLDDISVLLYQIYCLHVSFTSSIVIGELHIVCATFFLSRKISIDFYKEGDPLKPAVMGVLVFVSTPDPIGNNKHQIVTCSTILLKHQITKITGANASLKSHAHYVFYYDLHNPVHFIFRFYSQFHFFLFFVESGDNRSLGWGHGMDIFVVIYVLHLLFPVFFIIVGIYVRFIFIRAASMGAVVLAAKHAKTMVGKPLLYGIGTLLVMSLRTLYGVGCVFGARWFLYMTSVSPSLQIEFVYRKFFGGYCNCSYH
ncbi:hypothetical protein ACJX0J_008842, partial [Zea mays]